MKFPGTSVLFGSTRVLTTVPIPDVLCEIACTLVTIDVPMFVALKLRANPAFAVTTGKATVDNTSTRASKSSNLVSLGAKMILIVRLGAHSLDSRGRKTFIVALLRIVNDAIKQRVSSV